MLNWQSGLKIVCSDRVLRSQVVVSSRLFAFISLLSGLLIISLVTTGGIAHAKVIEGYELLTTPQPESIYKPGRSWVRGVGPNGASLGNVLTGAGAKRLTSLQKKNISVGLTGSIKRWISAVLGLSAGQVTNVSFSDLRLTQIEDLYKTKAKGLLLYETISASGIDITFSKDISGKISLKSLASSSLEFVVNGENAKVYHVTNDKGQTLVVAIKVVNLNYGKIQTSSGNLPLGKVGARRNIGLGYTALLTARPNLSEGSISVRISNPLIVQFQGETTRISLAEPWVSPSRFAINTDNKQLVWDLIEMAWSGTNVELTVSRQKLTIESARAGF